MLWIFLFIAISAGAAWIAGLRSRRRMGGALGREVKNRELTSISTWMAVDEAEKGKTQGGRASNGDS
jgi:hypothetical protein